MSVVKCPRCGMQMGAGAYSNCPACNNPMDEKPEPNPATEPAATETPADAEAETETE